MSVRSRRSDRALRNRLSIASGSTAVTGQPVVMAIVTVVSRRFVAIMSNVPMIRINAIPKAVGPAPGAAARDSSHADSGGDQSTDGVQDRKHGINRVCTRKRRVGSSNAYSTIASHSMRERERKLPLHTTVCN